MYDVIIGSSFYETVQVNITLTIPYSGYILFNLLALNFALFITKQVLGERKGILQYRMYKMTIQK